MTSLVGASVIADATFKLPDARNPRDRRTHARKIWLDDAGRPVSELADSPSEEPR